MKSQLILSLNARIRLVTECLPRCRYSALGVALDRKIHQMKKHVQRKKKITLKYRYCA